MIEVKVYISQHCTGFSMSVAGVPTSACARVDDDLGLGCVFRRIRSDIYHIAITHTYIYSFLHTNTHTYIQTYVRTYTHAYIHTYIHTFITCWTHAWRTRQGIRARSRWNKDQSGRLHRLHYRETFKLSPPQAGGAQITNSGLRAAIS